MPSGMPKELVAVAVRTPSIREYEDGPLGVSQVRVRTLQGAPKHGTEMHMYRGENPFADSRFDSEQRIFLPGTGDKPAFPMTLGNIAVGLVTEVGAEVRDFRVGDRVAGYGPLKSTQTWAVGKPSVYPGVRKMPERMTWQEAVCLDPATVALGGVRDGNIKIGDRVAVFGLGAIGLIAVQLAKIAGASFVVAIDPIAARRDVASHVGADLVLDPTACDAGLEIRNATGPGVDVALETSGSARALHHAIRGLAFRGTVALVAWYNEFKGGLDFGREAHFNRPTFVFPRAESEPHYDHPRWNNQRQADAAWELLVAGRIACDEIVQPVVSFADSVDAYRRIDEHPEQMIKLGVTFD
jgi:threonine dehydrogenase-like Zn-dependent dehydrogenase